MNGHPRTGAALRTNVSFRQRLDDEHHKEISPLERLDIDMVEDFAVADDLHLLYLGIMKKSLSVWIQGSIKAVKLDARQIVELSELLINSKLPTEIHRSVRGLDCWKFWKGIEFRTFLLYLGPVILKSFLTAEVYQHFLLLFCAITTCSNKIYHQHLDLAQELLIDYIEVAIDIYGIDSIGPNMHYLSHLVADVKKLGPLPNISSFVF